MEVNKVKTCELKKRQGVEKFLAEPYKMKEVIVKGPAVILVVID